MILALVCLSCLVNLGNFSDPPRLVVSLPPWILAPESVVSGLSTCQGIELGTMTWVSMPTSLPPGLGLDFLDFPQSAVPPLCLHSLARVQMHPHWLECLLCWHFCASLTSYCYVMAGTWMYRCHLCFSLPHRFFAWLSIW